MASQHSYNTHANAIQLPKLIYATDHWMMYAVQGTIDIAHHGIVVLWKLVHSIKNHFNPLPKEMWQRAKLPDVFVFMAK